MRFTEHLTADCPHFRDARGHHRARDPTNPGFDALPHVRGEVDVRLLGRLENETGVVQINGVDYLVGSASGADNNCLIDTLRQKLGNLFVSLAGVRDELAMLFPSGPGRIRKTDAGNFLELELHWAAVVRLLGQHSGHRLDPANFKIVCVDLQRANHGDVVGTGRIGLHIARVHGNHFVPLLRYHGARGPLPLPW